MSYMYRPIPELFKDYLAKKWIKDYTLAKCKYMLGEARSKFNTIAGPKAVHPNGDALKQEAIAEMERLDAEVKTQTAGGQGYSLLIRQSIDITHNFVVLSRYAT